MAEIKNVVEELAIVLPSLNPDEKFAAVVRGLIEKGFEHIVIVDDGSSADHQRFFAEADKAYAQTHVIHHGINKGKGRALKTGISYVEKEMPQLKGVITIDGDGQHLADDIIACGKKMLELDGTVVLGSRNFDQEGVPSRSVTGNKFTSKMFSLFFGIRINDTQTGLRAIPAELFDFMCNVEGERFEYETNMLLIMKHTGIPFYEQTITTVYDPDDYSSHYNALKDSYRIGKIMFKYLTRKKNDKKTV